MHRNWKPTHCVFFHGHSGQRDLLAGAWRSTYVHGARCFPVDQIMIIDLSCTFAFLTLSAHCDRPRKMPGWIVPVDKIFCKQAGILAGFLSGFASLVIFSEFLVCFCFICCTSAFKSFILKS